MTKLKTKPKIKTGPKTKAKNSSKVSRPKKGDLDHYTLRLYVAGKSAKSAVAIENLKAICETHLNDRYSIEVIDLSKNPEMAALDQVLALPTLVRRLPPPVKRIIGDLSNSHKVLVSLEVRGIEP